MKQNTIGIKMGGRANDMNKVKYTLDESTDGKYTFLKYPEEVEQLVIPITEINLHLSEGDIVEISKVGDKYEVKVLQAETEKMHKKISSIIEKLKNKH
ncbi:DUF3006 domain-containing protein [Sporosarcina sp. CAU 1771]